MEAALIVLVVTALVVGAMKWASRPHTALLLQEGEAKVQRGKPPPALVHDLSDIARATPAGEGRVLLSGAGDKVHIDIEGLDEGMAQRVRNVVRMHQQRIR